jgi:hypothetical protein
MKETIILDSSGEMYNIVIDLVAQRSESHLRLHTAALLFEHVLLNCRLVPVGGINELT